MTIGLLVSGGSETFQDKVNFFQRELRQVHMKRPHSKVTLKVSRHSLLDSVSVFYSFGSMISFSEKTVGYSLVNMKLHAIVP